MLILALAPHTPSLCGRKELLMLLRKLLVAGTLVGLAIFAMLLSLFGVFSPNVVQAQEGDPQARLLTVRKTGSGNGTVTSQRGNEANQGVNNRSLGVDCGTIYCAVLFPL